MHVTEAENTYLRAHVWGLLATGRQNGSPQMSMVAYDWDGTDLVISCRSSAAKYVNARRTESVVFAVPDDLDNLTVTGTAICWEAGAERDRLTERLRDRLADGHPWASDLLDADMAAGLDDVNRVVIQVVPTSIQLLTPHTVTGPPATTLVQGAFHRPGEPRHFMRIVQTERRYVATAAGRVIADSAQPFVVKEVGHDIYDPVVYFPRDDVDMAALVQIDKTTHCPLKGDTEYFDIASDGQHFAEAAWSYVTMINDDPLLRALSGLVAFDSGKVSVAAVTSPS